MAGTTKSVKRAWSFYTQTAGVAADAFRTFFETLNNLVTDVETLRAPSTAQRLASPTCFPVFSPNSTPEDLDISSFSLIDSDGILRVYGNNTVTTLTTMTVTLNTYGSFLFEAKNDGTISSQVPDATASYATAQLALTAALALTPATDTVAFAVLIIEADAGDWIANTDSFTDDLEEFGAVILGGSSVVAGSLVAATMTTPESQD